MSCFRGKHDKINLRKIKLDDGRTGTLCMQCKCTVGDFVKPDKVEKVDLWGKK